MSAPSLARRVESAVLYGVAALVLLAACLVTASRLLLPGIDRHRALIESMLAEALHQPVAIERIEAEWSGWTPLISVDGIRLLERGTGRAITSFDRLRFSIDPLASLRARALVPEGLRVSGLVLTLTRNAAGGVVIEGVSAGGQPAAEGASRNALADWVLGQPRLDVDSARITWLERDGLREPLVFSDVRLDIRNEDGRRRIAGVARLAPEVGRALQFVLEWRGDLLRGDWAGELYVQARGLAPSLIADRRTWPHAPGLGGEVDFELWSVWREATLQEVTGRVSAPRLELSVGAHDLELRDLAAGLLVRREGAQRWQFGLTGLRLTTASGNWPASHLGLSLDLRPDGGLAALVAEAEYLRLEDLAALLPGLEAVPPRGRAALAGLAPSGVLRDTRVGWRPDAPAGERLGLATTVDALGWRPWEGLPGVSGVAGEVRLREQAGELRLDTRDLRLAPATSDGGETADIELGALAGTLGWTAAEGAWTLTSPALSLEHPGYGLSLRGEARSGAEGGVVVDLAGSVAHGRVDTLVQRLAAAPLPARTREWLSRALQGGRITDGAFLLRGPLAEFPFDAGQGSFEARLLVEEGLLAFSPKWPRLEELEAEVLFSGRQLRVRAAGGRMLDGEVLEAEARLADLGAPAKVVEVEGRARLDLATARRIIEDSPLAERVGPRLRSLALDGAATLELGLDIPLADARKTAVRGVVVIRDQPLGSAGGPVLEDASGRIRFTRDEWSVDIPQGRLAGLAVSARGEFRMDQPGTRVLTLAGRIDTETLRERVGAWAPRLADWLGQRRLLGQLAGATDWEAELELNEPTAGSPAAPRRVTLRSGLEGLALTLPAPLGKAAGQTVPLSVSFSLGELDEGAARPLQLRYGEVLDARLALGAGGLAPAGASVVLGGGRAGEPEGGVRVRGTLAEVSLSDWLGFLDQLPRGAGGAAPPRQGPLPALDVDLRAGRIEALGQWFEDTGLRVRPENAGWGVEIDGARLAGRLTLPAAGSGEPLRASFARMLLERPAPEGPRHRPDPRRIPPLEVECERFAFAGMELGQAQLRTRPGESGLELESLRLVSPAATIEAHGSWTLTGRSHVSRFDIEARAGELGRLLSTFGYAGTAIAGGATRIAISASWAGSPAEFTLQGLDGTLDLKVAEGRMLDLDPGQGRLFGLISLQTLPRRLSLDFSDIFESGFAFDRIEGRFRLDEGNAYTSALVMDGPSARVEVSGRTGLQAQDYDQRVTVTPKVSNALPVASVFFGPIGAAVGGALLIGQEMFKGLPRQFDRLLGREYAVKGPWSDPQVSRLDATPGPVTQDVPAPQPDPG